MINFVDMHVLTRLKLGWDDAKAAGLAEWQNLFRSQLPQDLLEGAWDELNRMDIQFRSSFTPVVETNSRVVIGVTLESEELTQEFLGYSNDVPGGHDRFDWLSQAVVGIFVVAPNKELVRVLSYFIHCALLSSIGWFQANGCDGPRYQGARDMYPEPELEPQTVNVYMRVQKWSFAGAAEHGRIGGATTRDAKVVMVYDKSLFVNAYVDQVNHVEVPLVDNLPGGVDPTTE